MPMSSQSSNFLVRHYQEVLSSIKEMDVEETFDLYFSRFFGLIFAKWGKAMQLTPTHISFLSLAAGIPGGILLYWQSEIWIVAIGCFLISLAGVLDSADGQLARMTGSSTEFGRMVDGTIDNMVFMACYFAGFLSFLDSYGFIYIGALAMIAGFLHSVKSSVYEFYKCEYQELMEGKIESSIPYEAKDVGLQGPKWYHKVIYYIILDYTNKQLRFVTRSIQQRQQMRFLASDNETKTDFLNNYRGYNKVMLSWWAIFSGTNTHRSAIMLCALFGRLDLYFWTSIAWTVCILPVSYYQSIRDRKLLQQYNLQTAS